LKAAVEKIVIFNVGQGNGIIMVTDKAYWIIDFGSDVLPTTYSKEGPVHTKENRIEAAQKLLNEDSKRKIIVLVTHPDSDHYKYLGELLVKNNKVDDYQGRIVAWIYSNVYNVNDFTEIKDYHEELKIEEKRYVVFKEDLGVLDVDQTIFFVNAPSIQKEEKNANSMILRVEIKNANKDRMNGMEDENEMHELEARDHFVQKGKTSSEGNTILLTGDATNLTLAHMNANKLNSDKISGMNDLEGNNSNLNSADEWDPFKGVDYLVIPHHGSDLEGSDKFSEKVEPKRGVIFSAPVHSKHGHPAFASVVRGLKSITDQSSFSEKEEYLIYAKIKDGMTEEEIDKVLEGTDTSRVFCYSFGDGLIVNEEFAKSNELFPPNYPKKIKHCFLSSKRQVYQTGVSGNIVCTLTECKPEPLFDNPEDKKTKSLEIKYNDLQYWVKKFGHEKEYKYVYTKFSTRELESIINNNRPKSKADSTQNKLGQQTSRPTRSTKTLPDETTKNYMAKDWHSLLNVLKLGSYEDSIELLI
jgi:beta-lactamase superfamily II metal-dependent hydrolase